MHPQSPRQRKFWTMLSAFVLLIALATIHTVSLGASTATLPLPVNLPIPDTVLHVDNFGNAMAIDGNTLVVGAPWTVVNGVEQQGLAYIYTSDPNDPTVFTLLKSITGSNSGRDESFGWSVSLQGDTIVVGNGKSGLLQGSEEEVYVFQRNQGGENNWGEVKKLLRTDGKTLTYFGRTVAIDGDTLAVGAPLGLGQVLLYQRNQEGDNQWGQTQILDGGIPITTTPKGASFGHAIALDGTRLAISAPKAGLTAADVPFGSPAPSRNFEGATFIYRQVGGQWELEAKVFPSNLDLDHLDQVSVFGGTVSSLALNGDLLFVGAPFGTTDGVMAGKVYVYQRGAGTLGPFGQPGEWGEIAQLSPSDGIAGDHFGRALYAVDEGLFVSSEKQGVGKVYFFRNPAGLVNVSATSPQAPLAWSEVYSFTTSTDGSSTQFGLPIAGSGNTVVLGDRVANGNRGAVSLYPKDELFAADANATPSPTPTSTPTEPPTGSEPCVATQELTSALFLPMVSGGVGSTKAASLSSSAQAVAQTAPFVGNLDPGCVVTGPGGVKIGAVAGAITQTLALTLATTAAPPEALPAGSTPVGEFLRLTSAKNKLVDMETPFVIAVPVPANADTAHLGIVHLLPATYTLDSEVSGNLWGIMPGVYDAASALFLARMPFVLAEGTTFVLVENSDFDSPANLLPSRVQSAAAAEGGEFSVYCQHNTFAKVGDCSAAMEADAKTILDEIYQRMTDPAIFGFPRKLRLFDSGSQFIVSETISVTESSAPYAAYIHSTNEPLCAGAAGYYTPETGALVLCASAGDMLDADDRETLIHEFFHAVQYTYPTVLKDRELYRDQDWVIEGMAAASSKSYPATIMQRTPRYGLNNLQKVDQSLTTGRAGDSLEDEYLAQDFWVYVGASQGKGLEYLGPLLASGGAHQEGLDRAFNTLYRKSLSDFYWEWVKNQTIENALNVGVGPGAYCMLSPTALITGMPIEFPASEMVFPFNQPSAFDTLSSLTAKVVEIKFGSKTSALVMMEYEGCVGLQDRQAKASCDAAAQKTLRSKIYVEGEPQCDTGVAPRASEAGLRFLSAIDPNKRYFVVVANSDPDKVHEYYIAIE